MWPGFVGSNVDAHPHLASSFPTLFCDWFGWLWELIPWSFRDIGWVGRYKIFAIYIHIELLQKEKLFALNVWILNSFNFFLFNFGWAFWVANPPPMRLLLFGLLILVLARSFLRDGLDLEPRVFFWNHFIFFLFFFYMEIDQFFCEISSKWLFVEIK